MITFKDYTENYTCFTYSLLRFKSQTNVIYDTPVANIRLSKSDLIVCIKYILFRFSQLGYLDNVKHGFVLDKFKYFELSVYLHGLLVVYSGILDLCPPTKLSIKRFSNLPHDVMKSEKKIRDFEVALVDDFNIGRYYVCVINGKPICSHTLAFLQSEVYSLYPQFKDYNLNFIVK